MILILLSVLLILADQKLVMVQSVFRHGARYPIYPNKYDNTTYSIQQDKTGQLTSSGKRMHYLLGQLMYQQYWKQLGLGNKLNQTFIYVKSTNVNRTIESVQSQLFGMFEKLQGWSLNETQANLSYPSWRNSSNFDIQSKQGAVYPGIQNFHSTPIHVQKLGSDRLDPGDFLRNYAPQNCPSQHKWQEQNQKSQLALSIYNIPRMQQAIKQITQFYHFDYNMTLYNMSNYIDNYFCSKYLDKPYAKNIYEGPYKQEYSIYQLSIDYINTLSLYINLFFTDLQINATVSGFLNATRDNMMNVMKSSMEQKLIIYSAHDTTVANVLAGFRLATAQCVLDQYLKKNSTGLPACIVDYPYYASNLILQLHQNDTTQKYYVKLRYNGDYLPLFVCGNKVQCPWQQFDKFLVDTIRPNYLEQCGIPEFITKNKTLQTWLIVGASVMGGLFIILVIHILCKSRKLSKQAVQNNISSLSESLVIPN